MAMRTSIGCSYENGTNTLGINGSYVLESPFFKGRVTPYWGGGLHVAYDVTQSANGEDWTRQSVLTGQLGGLIGAEYFIAEYISLFAEYELFLGLSNVVNAQSIAGAVTENSVTNFEIATDLGNNASIGVVIYVKPVFEIEED